MTNILKKLGVGTTGFAHWFGAAIKGSLNLASKVETILKAEQPLQAPFVAALATVISDIEALITDSSIAVSAEGLNFPADSRVYQQFVTLVDDFQKLGPVTTQVIQILEGKAPASVATPTPAPTAAAIAK